MDYTNYLKGLLERAEVAKESLENWRDKTEEIAENESILLNEMSRFIGYCLALEGLIEDKPEKLAGDPLKK